MNRPTPSPTQATAARDRSASPTPPPARSPWRRTRCHQADPYVAGLHDEWSRLADGLELEPDVLALLDHARRHHDGTLSGIADLDGLVAAMHRHGDGPLLFAIEAAQAGSYVAARAIIQTMLPKLGRLAHSVRAGRCFGSVMAEAVAAMYEVIYRYPRDRRRRSVAANLALDTLKALRRELGVDLPVSAPHDLVGAACTSSRPRGYSTITDHGPAGSDELAQVLADAQHQDLLTAAEAHMLWLVATGDSRADVASQIGISPDALRQRYSRTCAALRARARQLID